MKPAAAQAAELNQSACWADACNGYPGEWGTPYDGNAYANAVNYTIYMNLVNATAYTNVVNQVTYTNLVNAAIYRNRVHTLRAVNIR
jgi:hypothetical protein